MLSSRLPSLTHDLIRSIAPVHLMHLLEVWVGGDTFEDCSTYELQTRVASALLRGDIGLEELESYRDTLHDFEPDYDDLDP